MISAYEQFLNSKHIKSVPTGLKEVRPMATKMFDYQQDITSWALRRGRAGIFEDCGLGKTIQELEWAKQVSEAENGKVLLIAPLMVSAQHVIEAEKFGYDVRFCRINGEVQNGINITNYEKLHKFDLSQFVGVALDESSILKSFDSKTRVMVTEAFRETPYRSAWTATPAPNDFMELGNHAEFLGVMNRSEMLATFFVHDGGESAREHDDERHICPLQLQVIERAVQLWSNPGDIVFSPFAGIGSEGYQAVKMGRRFIGIELKQSYFKQAVLNLQSANQINVEFFPEVSMQIPISQEPPPMPVAVTVKKSVKKTQPKKKAIAA